MSLSFRANKVPRNVILWYNESGALPEGYSHECTLFNKYLKGVPDSSTNPGACVGSNTHCDPAVSFAHTHPATSVSHRHNTAWGPSNNHNSSASTSGSISVAAVHSHTHVPSSTTAVNITTASSGPSHHHNTATINNEPPFYTIRNIKNTNTVFKFRRGVPWKAIVARTTQTTIKGYSYTVGCNRFLKGVANACTAPATTGGTTSHSHTLSSGGHSHTLSIGSHTHVASGTSGPPSTLGTATAHIVMLVASSTHTHTGTINLNDVTNVTSSGSTSHTHGSSCHLPLYYESVFSKRGGISFRSSGVPAKSIVVWLGTLASIPDGFKLADGTFGTPDLFNRYLRSTLNTCSTPGSTGGSSTHNHPANTHTHTTCGSHAHTTSGTSSDTYGSIEIGSGSQTLAIVHLHSRVNPSGTAICSDPLQPGGSHQHGPISNNPVSKEVAFIFKLS